MDILSNFSERLQELMFSNNISAGELAERIGVDSATIYKWLSKEYFPSSPPFFRLLEYFQCSADYLFGLTDDYPENKRYAPPTNEFGKRLREVMKETKTSQYALNKKHHISSFLVHQWLKGNVLPNTVQIVKLASIMQVSVDYLLGRD